MMKTNLLKACVTHSLPTTLHLSAEKVAMGHVGLGWEPCATLFGSLAHMRLMNFPCHRRIPPRCHNSDNVAAATKGNKIERT